MTPLSGIITKGLGLPACQSMIIARFDLGPCGVVTTLAGVGGSVPLKPGQVQNLYTPVSPEYHLISKDIPLKKQHVVLTITFDGGKNVKEFLLPNDKWSTNLTIKGIKFASKTTNAAKVTLDNFRKRVNDAVVRIKNFRKRDK